MIYEIDITELWANRFEEICTPDGVQKINRLVRKYNKKCLSLMFKNSSVVECSEDHLIETVDGWKMAKDLEKYDEVLSEDGVTEFLFKKDLGLQNVYDLEVNHDNHRYWSEGISSHNTGKSSLSHAIVKEIGGEALWVNASLERGIDTLRGKIQNFASSSSFDDKIKIVVMDECDHLSSSAQAAFRGFLDEFGANCRFIFTGNYKDQIIEPLINRLENYDFNQLPKKEMIKPIFERLKLILDSEGVKYDPKDVAELIGEGYPSIRSMISNLQKFSTTGELKFSKEDLGNLSSLDEIMKSTDYLDMISSVNNLSSPSSVYTELYNNSQRYFRTDSLPQVIVAIAKYQEMNSSVRDKHLNLAACLTELWKHKI